MFYYLFVRYRDVFRCFILSLSDRWMCLDVLLSFKSDRGMCLDVLLSLCQIEVCVYVFYYLFSLIEVCV